MASLGFYCFTSPTPVVELTLKEKISLLSAGQKTALLDSYINAVPAAHVYHKIMIPLEVVEGVYEAISDMQSIARSNMRREVVITPAVVDQFGVIITPAVMNIAPTTQAELTTLLQPMFADVFTAGQVTAIVNAMMKWSKYDGTGTFAFYASQIIL